MHERYLFQNLWWSTSKASGNITDRQCRLYSTLRTQTRSKSPWNISRWTFRRVCRSQSMFLAICLRVTIDAERKRTVDCRRAISRRPWCICQWTNRRKGSYNGDTMLSENRKTAKSSALRSLDRRISFPMRYHWFVTLIFDFLRVSKHLSMTIFLLM